MSEEKKGQSEQEIKEDGFWTKNIISILLIVFLIVSGIYAFNREPKTEEKSVEEKVEKIKNEGEVVEENIDLEENLVEKPQIQKTESQITVKANHGDGVTHLARKAVVEYTKDKEITLSKEQKLYTETVLKNKYYQHHLNLSQEVAFELSDLEDTVQKAKDLSETEIKSWSKYTHLVKAL